MTNVKWHVFFTGLLTFFSLKQMKEQIQVIIGPSTTHNIELRKLCLQGQQQLGAFKRALNFSNKISYIWNVPTVWVGGFFGVPSVAEELFCAQLCDKAHLCVIKLTYTPTKMLRETVAGGEPK